MSGPERLPLVGGVLDLGAGLFERAADGERVGLTPRELALLQYLATRPGELVPRQTILVEVWEYHPDVVSRAADSTMQRLRKKIEVDPTNPDHLHTHHGEGFRLELPPPSLAPESTRPLPNPLGELLGREEELTRAREALDAGTRLLLIHGPPGVGKSQLGLAVARGWSGGAWYCDLARVQAPGTALGVLAEVLGVRAGGLSEARVVERIGGALAQVGARVVLLDGADAAVSLLEQWVRGWLQAAPEVRLLVTSRRTMEAPGVTQLTLGGLPSEVALPLLRRWAAGALDGVDDERLQALVCAYDGNPSVLEHLARRAQTVGAVSVLERAIGGAATSVLDDSLAYVSEPAAGLLLACATFLGRFTLSEAAAVARLHPRRAEALLEELAGASLIHLEGGQARLAGVVREDARLRLRRRHDCGAVARRHLDLLLAGLGDTELLSTSGSPALRARHQQRDPALLDLAQRLELDQPELAASARLARDPWLRITAPIAETLANAEAVFLLWDVLGPELRCRTLVALGGAEVLAERFSEGHVHLDRARDLARRLELPTLEIEACLLLGSSMTDRRPAESAEVLREAAELARSKGLVGWGRLVAFRQALADLGSGDPVGAEARIREILPGVVVAGEALLELRCRTALGIVASRRGADEDAVSSCEKALDLARRLELPERTANTRGVLGASLLQLGRSAEAAPILARAAEQHRGLGQAVHAASVDANLAMAYLDLGNAGMAETLLVEALPVLHAAGWWPTAGAAQASLGLVLHFLGRSSESVELLRQARERFGDADPAGAWSIGVLAAHAVAVAGFEDESHLLDLWDEAGSLEGTDPALAMACLAHVAWVKGRGDWARNLRKEMPAPRSVDARLVCKLLDRVLADAA